MGWSEDVYSRRTVPHDHDQSPPGLSTPKLPDRTPRPANHSAESPFSSAKALQRRYSTDSKSTGESGKRDRQSNALDGSKEGNQGSSGGGGDGMGSLLLVGAAVASTALQKAGLLSPGKPPHKSPRSAAAAAANARRSRNERPPLPQPILATTPRGYHDTRVKTPRGATPRSVRFFDDPDLDDATSALRTPRAAPPVQQPPTPAAAESPVSMKGSKNSSSGSNNNNNNNSKHSSRRSENVGSSSSSSNGGGRHGRGGRTNGARTPAAKGQQVPSDAIVPAGRAAGMVARLPIQAAALLYDAVVATGGSVAGVATSPFRPRPKRIQPTSPVKHKSPRTPTRSGSARAQTPVSPAGSAHSSTSSGSKPSRSSVEIPRLSLSDRGVGGGEGGKQAKSPSKSSARSSARTPALSPVSSGRNNDGEAASARGRSRPRSPLRGGPLGFLGGNKLAARCQEAEAEADALEEANEKLRRALKSTEARLAAAEAAGRESREAASQESARRATALSEANKQLERLESKLKQRQAAVDGLVTPRSRASSLGLGGTDVPSSPHSVAASPRVGLNDYRYAFKSPRGDGRSLWASSPRTPSGVLTLAGDQTPRSAAAAAITERRIAELRAKLSAQQTRADDALCRVDDVEAKLAERDAELDTLKARLAEGLSSAQQASAADLRRQLAAERNRTTDQAQLVKHLQESLGADGERITDLQRQLGDCQAAMETFDDQAEAQVAYVADLQDMCEELQSMQTTMKQESSASNRKASSLQDQLNASLGVIERLEKDAAERNEDVAAERAALESALEDTRALNDELNRKLQQSQLAVQLAEADRDAAVTELNKVSAGGEGKGSSDDDSSSIDDDSAEDRAAEKPMEGAAGRATSSRTESMASMATREELYKAQIQKLQEEVALMRKESRTAKEPEVDRSTEVRHLESRLTEATKEHEQDVRRMAETIQELEKQLREVRQQAASHNAKGAGKNDSVGIADNDSNPAAPEQPETPRGEHNADGAEDSSLTGPGSPVANRLLELTKRLEDVMGVSLQRTSSSHLRMSSPRNQRAALDAQSRTTSSGSLSRPSINDKRPPLRPPSTDLPRKRARPPTVSRTSADSGSPYGMRSGAMESPFGRPPRTRSLERSGSSSGPGSAMPFSLRTVSAGVDDGAKSQGSSPTASGLLTTVQGGSMSQGVRNPSIRSSSSSGLGASLPQALQLERRASSNASLAGASVDFIVPPADDATASEPQTEANAQTQADAGTGVAAPEDMSAGAASAQPSVPDPAEKQQAGPKQVQQQSQQPEAEESADQGQQPNERPQPAEEQQQEDHQQQLQQQQEQQQQEQDKDEPERQLTSRLSSTHSFAMASPRLPSSLSRLSPQRAQQD